ncbi:MAG: hypothetical protein FWD03_03620 [Defluviitaleaceae bacterium]|nr:hypothetical protein [Defluviitaleaceae bacterium]
MSNLAIDYRGVVDKISWALPHDVIIGLLNIMYKPDTKGNKPTGAKLKNIIIKYAYDNLKIIPDSMERQYKKANLNLSQTIKEDIVIAIIAQYMAEDMQYAYDSEMDSKTVAVTLDSSNAAGTSGYNDEITSAGYKRQKVVDELKALGLTKQTDFKGVLNEQIEIDKEKGLVKADFKDNPTKGGGEGYFYGSHAERELSHRTERPIGVSRRMCNECVNYFRNLQSQRVVADPDFIWIFEADGDIKVFTNNASEKQLKTKMRNFYKKYGITSTNPP